MLPHASHHDCRRARRLRAPPRRRFRLGFVGAVGPEEQYLERRAFFALTCSLPRWLRTEDGVWRRSEPCTDHHFALDRNTTLVDAFLLSCSALERLCPKQPGGSEGLPDANMWWIEPEWRWRLVPEVGPGDDAAYFARSFSIPYYGFSDGGFAAVFAEALSAGRSLSPLRVERRAQPAFNALLYESIYGHADLCLVLPGDTSDCAKRLWDAMVRGCVPVFASAGPRASWPVLPFAAEVPWASFSWRFHHVNSTDAARRVLRLLARLPAAGIQRRRVAMLRWLPRLVVERSGCVGNGTAAAVGGRGLAQEPSALSLALREAAARSRAALADRAVAPEGRGLLMS